MAIIDKMPRQPSYAETGSEDDKRWINQVNKFIAEHIEIFSGVSVAAIVLVIAYLSMNYQIVNKASPEELQAALAQHGATEIDQALLASLQFPDEPVVRESAKTVKIILPGHEHETQLSIGDTVLVRLGDGTVVAQISDLIVQDEELVTVNVHLPGPDGQIVTENTSETEGQPALGVFGPEAIVGVAQ